MHRKILMISFLFLLTIILVVSLSHVSAHAGREYILATPNCIPFLPNNGPVFLFKFEGTGPLTEIPSIPQDLVNYPCYVAFNKKEELFVSNGYGYNVPGEGSISRFILNSDGTFKANGVITGNGLERVSGLAFSLTGELFAANYWAGTISRFLFDEEGNAVANGIIPNAVRQGLAFSENGELFSAYGSGVKRFLFDPVTGDAIPNGSFTLSGNLHGLAFNDKGELFVADVDTYNRVLRVLFDGNGNPIMEA